MITLETVIGYMRLAALSFVLVSCIWLGLQRTAIVGSNFFDLCVAFGALIFSVMPLFAMMSLLTKLNKLDNETVGAKSKARRRPLRAVEQKSSHLVEVV